MTIIEVLRQISSKVKKRFPTYSHLVEAGVMTKNEMSALERAQTMTDYPVYWVPISWASNLVTQAWENGYMKVLDWMEYSLSWKTFSITGARILYYYCEDNVQSPGEM